MLRTKTIFLILCLLFILGYTGEYWGGTWYFDTGNTYFHFVGGLFIGLLIASYYSTQLGKLSQPLRLFCILGMVMGVGVLWEFHEFVLDHIFNTLKFQGDLADTMQDLLMDSLGGISATLYLFWRPNAK